MHFSVHGRCTNSSPTSAGVMGGSTTTSRFPESSFVSFVKRKKTVAVSMLLFMATAFCSGPAQAQQGRTSRATLDDHREIMAPAVSKRAAQGPIMMARPAKALLDGKAALVGKYNSEQMLRLAIGLQPPHLAEEKQLIGQLLDKKSPMFHKFLTAAQWNARFAPSALDEQALIDWAQSQGLTVTQRYPSRLVVDIEAPISTIEKAFAVNINKYAAADNSTFFSNDREITLPANLTSVVQSVAGLSSLQTLHPANKGMIEPAMPLYSPGPVSQTVTPAGGKLGVAAQGKKADLKSNAPQIVGYAPTDLYNSEAYSFSALNNQGHCCNPFHVGEGSTGSPVQSSIAVATAGLQQTSDFVGFHNQYPYLAMFWGGFTYVDGTPTCCDSEGTMDFEWATAMSNSFGSEYDTAHVEMYDGANTAFSTFIDIFNKIASDSAARTMTTSWGCVEIECWDESNMTTVDNTFASMVGQGWTLLAASGDSGASASCLAQDGVSFPASDPYVIAAGGTTLTLTTGPNYQSETGWSGGPDGCSTNDGGSTGGCSQFFAAPGYQTQNGAPACGSGSRSVPDVALDADWYNTPETVYFQGTFYTDCQTQGFCGGGTSIVAPMMAGFFAQENSYALAMGNICGGSGTGACSPLGDADYYLYDLGDYGASHNPFYDITSGCNNNDVTTAFGLGYYCAGTGYDMVTGWGSVNALQLAWGVNYWIQLFSTGTSVNFSGPPTGAWYNTDQNVSWTVSANGSVPAGVAGFSQGWDSIPSDPYSEATPGTGNSFYNGPQFPNATSGYLALSWAGQGCHTANVQAWDNTGISSGDATYGELCYDNVAPVTTASLSGTLSSGIYVSAVKVTLSAADSTSGVAGTFYQLDGGALTTYSVPFTVSNTGSHTVVFHSKDHAGNVEANKSVSFIIKAHTSTSLVASANPSVFGKSVTFTAAVTPAFGGVPAGNVTFKSGATTLGTAALASGKAAFSTAALAEGSDSITAVYAGNGNDLGSTSAALAHTVAKAATSIVITASANPSSFGQSVTFKATVKSSTTGVPAGTVTFKDGATNLSTVTLSAGVATFNIGDLALGNHTITAVYAGNVDFASSTSSALAQTVKKANTTTKVTSSLNPATKGQSVTLTATVTPAFSGAPAGNVTFKDGTSSLGIAAVNATTHQAVLKTSALSAATHPITAAYAGNADFNASTSAVMSQIVKP
jgi:Pro-kumamolisin, activation domain/Bacterial Ig-like domain (group 3)